MNAINGVVIGIVTNVRNGEAKVKFPWLHEKDAEEKESNWARIATAMAGYDRGTFFMPEVGDEVLVAFEQGDFNHPYIIGFLWNGIDRPPRDNPKHRIIRSLNGHEIEIFDPEVKEGDAGYIRIKDAHGNVVELGNARIIIQGVGDISIQSRANVYINGRLVVHVGPPI